MNDEMRLEFDAGKFELLRCQVGREGGREGGREACGLVGHYQSSIYMSRSTYSSLPPSLPLSLPPQVICGDSQVPTATIGLLNKETNQEIMVAATGTGTSLPSLPPSSLLPSNSPFLSPSLFSSYPALFQIISTLPPSLPPSLPRPYNRPRGRGLRGSDSSPGH